MDSTSPWPPAIEILQEGCKFIELLGAPKIPSQSFAIPSCETRKRWSQLLNLSARPSLELKINVCLPSPATYTCQLGPPQLAHPTSGGGNCFFHSLAWIITEDQMTDHLQIRRAISNYTEAAHLPSGGGQMAHSGTYATGHEVLATAAALNVRILMYSASLKAWTMYSPADASLFTPSQTQPPPLAPNLPPCIILLRFIGNAQNGHFQPVTSLIYLPKIMDSNPSSQHSQALFPNSQKPHSLNASPNASTSLKTHSSLPQPLKHRQ